MDYYIELFNILDTDNDGFITYDNILKCNFYHNTNHLDKYKKYINKTKYNRINIKQFIEIYKDYILTEKELNHIFDILSKLKN